MPGRKRSSTERTLYPSPVVPEVPGPSTNGVTRRVALKLLETYFSRPLIHLIPLIVLAALGVYSGLNTPKEFRSAGTLFASPSGTVLSDIAESSTNRGFGYDSPASATSRNISQQLRTNSFVERVVDHAGLRTAVDQGLLTYGDIRSSVWAAPEGDNLLAVVAATNNPEQSQRLAEATIDAYLEYVVTNDIGDLTIAIDTYQRQLDSYRAQLERANEAYEAYMLDHPIADEDDREFSERLDIARLEDGVERAADAAQAAESKLDDAQMQADVSQTVLERQLREVDAPTAPTVPEPRLRQAVMTFAMFTALGLLLSVVFVILAAFLDRTIREPADLPARFNVEVIAAVPRSSR
jgi:uncharacterized protein involved in exopolysaccharide biosynthesis